LCAGTVDVEEEADAEGREGKFEEAKGAEGS
jgi:hypothetical protein